MKKRISLCLLCMIAVLGFCLVGCDRGAEKHDFGTKWYFDANNHWKECVCGEKDEYNPHIFSGNLCTTCGYNKGHTHSIKTIPANAPTCTEDGNITYYQCTLCDKLFSDLDGEHEITKEETIDPAKGHEHADTWESDNSYHWHIATCEEHEGDIVDKDLHVMGEGNVCKICGKSEFTYDDLLPFEKSSDNSGYLLAGIGSLNNKKDLVVPATYHGEPVVGIKLAAFYDATSNASTAPNLESIILPYGIKSIGQGAFGKCAALKYISLPETLETIDVTAFSSCVGLEKITIPEKVQYIGEQTFYNCQSLKEIHFGSELLEIADAAFYNCISLKELILPEKLVSIGESAFAIDTNGEYTSALKKLVIPKSVARMNMNMLAGNTTLEYLSIPFIGFSRGENYPLGFLFDPSFFVEDANGEATVKAPDQVNGYVPSTLESVTLSNASYLPDFAFMNCNSLKNISISSDLVTIGLNAFDGCSKLQYYYKDGGVYIGNKENNYVALMKIENNEIGAFEMEDSTTVISDSVFADCSNLRNISFSDSLVNIESGVFSGCTNLKYNEYENGLYLGKGDNNFYVFVKPVDISVKTFKLHENTKIIAGGAFASCGRLENVEIPEGIIGIGRGAFASCVSLTEIHLPDGIRGIGSRMFVNDIELKELEIGNGIEAIGSDAFVNCINLTYATIPATLTESLPKSLIRILTIKGGEEVVQGTFEKAPMLEKLIIENDVYGIGKGAFNNCGNLKEVVIGDSVEYIEESAFTTCRSLEKIYFGKNVSLIVPSAFGMCNALTTVTVSPENQNMHSSGNCVIDTHSKTLVLGTCRSVIPGDGSVTKIGEYAFYGHSGNGTVISIYDDPYFVEGGDKVEEIFIPRAIKEFGIYSFASLLDCAVIKYEGSNDEWDRIDKVNGWDTNIGLYTDGYKVRYNQTR